MLATRSKSIIQILILIGSLFILPELGITQERVQFELNKNVVGLDEYIVVRLTIDGSRSADVNTDQVSHAFEYVGIQEQGVSMSYSFGTGRGAQSSVQSNYSVIFRPKREGQFSLSGIKVTCSGETYTSPTWSIRVTKQSTQNQQRRSNQRRIDDIFDQMMQQSPMGSQSLAKQLFQEQRRSSQGFIAIETPKQEYILGEPVVLDFYLYSPMQYRAPETGKLVEQLKPNLFWALEDYDPPIHPIDTVLKDGSKYQRTLLDQIILYSNQPGTESFGGYQLVYLNRRTDKPQFLELLKAANNFELNAFLQRKGGVGNVSNTVTIDVTPLPNENKPLDFSNFIGDLDISLSTDKKLIAVGDSFTLDIVLDGFGNHKVLSAPTFDQLASDITIFNPKSEDTFSVRDGKVYFTQTFSYQMVPKRAGSITIPSFSYSIYNPEKQTYSLVASQPYNISVYPKDPNSHTNSINTEDDALQTDSEDSNQTMDSDSSSKHVNLPYPIYKEWTEPTPPSENDPHIYFVLSLIVTNVGIFLVPLLGFGLFYYRRTQEADLDYVRKAKARKIMKTRLPKVEAWVEKSNPKEFYKEAEQLLFQYFSAYFNRPLTELTIKELDHEMQEENIDRSASQQITEILLKAQSIGYAPLSASQEDITADFTQIKKILHTLDKPNT